MHLARTIMVFLIALSLASLPAARSVAIGVGSINHVASATMHVHSDMPAAMDDCCPAQPTPCDHNSDHCQSMASCGVQCVGIADFAVSEISYPAVAASLFPVLTDQTVGLYDGSPPFRPPRL